VEALFLFYKIENWYTTVNCNNQGDKQIWKIFSKNSTGFRLYRHIVEHTTYKKQNKHSSELPTQERSHGHSPPLAPAANRTDNKCNIWQSRKIHSDKNNQNRHKKRRNQLLPSDDTAVFVNNKRLTRDLAKVVWYEVDKEQAHDHLTSHKGLTDN
jgi:hypothetical protein